MLTLGVDLAAEPAGTALAAVEWSAAGATVKALSCGVTDEDIVESAMGAAKIGIDCALGWPQEFVDFLVQHSSAMLTDVDGSMQWRRTLAYRETDRHAREITGRWPLSVATDRLGVTALRAAGLVSRLGRAGVDVDRSGSGGIVEVYPGASLRLWGFNTAGYKTSRDARESLVTSLLQLAPWIELGEWRDLMADSSDAFDAVIAAFAARSSALGHSTQPDAFLRTKAQIEGWIALPTQPLAALIGGSSNARVDL